jgi:hypothetical protein
MDDEGDREGLFLTDDPVPRRSRPRWLDGLGLGAVVLGIVAIGVLGDRGSPERRPAPTTTTSTTSTFRRGTPYASTTTTTEPPTTATTLVQHLIGDINRPTGAAVLLSTGSSLTLVDVDAGTAQRLPASAGFGMVGLDDGFLVPTGGALRLIPARGGAPVDLPLPEPAFESRLLRAGAHSVWTFDGPSGDTSVVTEIDATGRPAGGHVTLPSGVYLTGAVDGGVIADARGGTVFVDGRTGRARSLGTGVVLAHGRRTIVRTTSVVLRCRTEVVDVASGRSHTLAIPDVADRARQAQVSPDDNWLAVSYVDGVNIAHLLVANLRTGRSWTGDGLDTAAPIAFSPGGEVIFTTSAGSLCAFEVATALRTCLGGLQLTDVGEIAVAPLGR